LIKKIILDKAVRISPYYDLAYFPIAPSHLGLYFTDFQQFIAITGVEFCCAVEYFTHFTCMLTFTHAFSALKIVVNGLLQI
jgi:hypothetical protein